MKFSRGSGRKGGCHKLWAACGAGLCASALCFPRMVFGQTTIIDLGTLGGTYSTATGINDNGQVAGDSEANGNGGGEAFRWTPGGTNGVTTNPQMLALAPGLDTNALGINATGQVVGLQPAGSGFGFGLAFVWTPGGTDGITGNPQYKTIGTLGGAASTATGINAAGQITGNSGTTNVYTNDAFLWTKGGTAGPASNPQMQNLGVFTAAAINDSDQIAGTDPATNQALFYSNGGTQDLGTLGGNSSSGSAINDNGAIAGVSTGTDGQTHGFLWTPGGTSGVAGNPQMQDLGLLGGNSFSQVYGINNAGDVVGYSYLGNTAFLYTSAGGLQNLNSLLPVNSGWTLLSANGINNKGQIVGFGIDPGGQDHAFLLNDPALIVRTATNLVWLNTPTPHGDGMTWDIGNNTNWNSSSGVVAYIDGSNVTFDDSTPNTEPITLNTTVKPGSVTFNCSSNTYTIQGTGSIAGTGSLTLAATNTGTVFLNTANSYTGGTNVSGGSIFFGAPGALPNFTAVSVGGPGRYAIAFLNFNSFVSSLTLAGTTDNWTGFVDLGANDLLVQNGNLSTLTNQVKQGFGAGGPPWQGFGGITDTTAAFDSTGLTALGVIQNSVNGSPTGAALYSTIDGEPANSATVLIKYTYYGDANCDGKVDGSDYSRIDNGFLSRGSLTGWFNGDFNYDGVINGSDYTLIDNAYNNQGAAITDETARIAALVAVPEPSGISAIGGLALMMLRRRRHSSATVQRTIVPV